MAVWGRFWGIKFVVDGGWCILDGVMRSIVHCEVERGLDSTYQECLKFGSFCFLGCCNLLRCDIAALPFLPFRGVFVGQNTPLPLLS